MSLSLTSKDCKEEKHNRIEEAKAHGQGVLVDDGRDYEHGEHGSCSEFPFRQLWGLETETRKVLAPISGFVLVQCEICATRSN